MADQSSDSKAMTEIVARKAILSGDIFTSQPELDTTSTPSSARPWPSDLLNNGTREPLPAPGWRGSGLSRREGNFFIRLYGLRSDCEDFPERWFPRMEYLSCDIAETF